MITEETKIKDLIPEGKEIACQTINDNGIHIDFKNKEIKDWNWYVIEYFNTFDNRCKKIVTTKSYFGANSLLALKDYNKIPFEIKIGLLKFICDDLNTDWINFLYPHKDHERINNLSSICPKEFLNSIFE